MQHHDILMTSNSWCSTSSSSIFYMYNIAGGRGNRFFACSKWGHSIVVQHVSAMIMMHSIAFRFYLITYLTYDIFFGRGVTQSMTIAMAMEMGNNSSLHTSYHAFVSININCNTKTAAAGFGAWDSFHLCATDPLCDVDLLSNNQREVGDAIASNSALYRYHRQSE